LVRDRRVEAILHRKGKEVQRALFKEHVAPEVGSMVSIALPSGSFCVGRVDGISHGLIISPISNKDQQFKSDVVSLTLLYACYAYLPTICIVQLSTLLVSLV
jgi:hypothetical protein